MNDPTNNMSATRLFDASEAVMTALSQYVEGTGNRCPYPPDLMGSPEQPECLCDFTRTEVRDATLFLARLGYIDIRQRTK